MLQPWHTPPNLHYNYKCSFSALIFTLDLTCIVGVSALVSGPGWTWVPVVTICVYFVGCTVGFGSLPWFMTAELVPKTAQSWVTSCIVFYSFLLSFVVLKMFTPLTNSVGQSATFTLLSLTCVVGIVFVYYCVPETKNKSPEEIQASIRMKTRPRWLI